MTAPHSGVSPAILIAGAVGSILAYSGIKNKSITGSVQALLAGKSPADAASNPSLITSPSLDSGVGISSTSLGYASQQSFYSDVLSGLGAAPTSGALSALAGITKTEGVNNYYNPFNITWHSGDNPAWKGVATYNSAGVQQYGSYQQGVAATVAFLQQNSRWANVVAALHSGNQSMIESSLSAVYASWGAMFKPAGTDVNSFLGAPVGGG